MDWIELSRVEVKSRIGVPDQERKRPQKLSITVVMGIKGTAAAAKFDDVSKTVDYFPVYQEIHRLATMRPRRLLETLAEEISESVLAFSGVQKVKVTIYKYIFKDAEHVALTIERRRLNKRSKSAE